MEKYKLFETIKLIEGANRTLLLDSLRQSFYFLPKEEVKNIFLDKKNNEINPENPLLKFLKKEELIFPIDHSFFKNFTPIKNHWETVYPIDNILFFVNETTVSHLEKFINIDKFGQIHLIFNTEISNSTLNKVFYSLEFIYCDTIKITNDNGLNTNQLSFLIRRINSNIKRQIILDGISKMFVEKIKRKDSIFIYENKLNYDKLTYSINHYYEAQEYHTYFNKKVTIDEEGNILNDIKDKISFGNIRYIQNFEQILEISKNKDFNKKWYLKKSEIDICKVCEFRFNCVDPRQPILREEGVFHEIECNYNPYISKWEGEEGYKTLSECGVISNEKEFSIDHEKIEKINIELWGEE